MTTSSPAAPGLAARPLTVDAHPHLADVPFLAETLELFRSVREHDEPTLFARCDDDFGIVDLDTDGSSRLVRDRTEWEAWFRELFARLDATGAQTDTEIDALHGRETPEMGFGVCEFTQLLAVGEDVARFRCVVTLVWKRVEDRWVEARWHASLLGADVPPSMAATTA